MGISTPKMLILLRCLDRSQISRKRNDNNLTYIT